MILFNNACHLQYIVFFSILCILHRRISQSFFTRAHIYNVYTVFRHSCIRRAVILMRKYILCLLCGDTYACAGQNLINVFARSRAAGERDVKSSSSIRYNKIHSRYMRAIIYREKITKKKKNSTRNFSRSSRTSFFIHQTREIITASESPSLSLSRALDYS